VGLLSLRYLVHVPGPVSSRRKGNPVLAAPILALSLLLLGFPSFVPGEAQESTIVFLVRHAERADDHPGQALSAMDPAMAGDPPLSPEGRRRADLLAQTLADANLTHIHSTDTRRTRETAAPTSNRTGVEVNLYDAEDLTGMARALSSTPGRHLVVGHSNTTPELVGLLGGDPGPPIQGLEYDRLYVVSLQGTEVLTVLLRFGEPYRDLPSEEDPPIS
jgi:phosphohistidine phosphatase SixA